MTKPAELREKSRVYLKAADEVADLDHRRFLARHALALAELAEKIEREERTKRLNMVSKKRNELMEGRATATAKVDAVFAVMDKRASEHFFADRGFSAQTIHVLVANGVRLPEELLLMTEDETGDLPGLDSVGRVEVHAYRVRFLSPHA
jgi:hypothetical protein